jgi:hypothetical protein
MHFGKGATDFLLQLGLDAVRILEADVAGDLCHDVGMDALVAVAQLDIDAPPHLRVGLDDLAHASGKLCVSSSHVLATNHVRLQGFEVHVNARCVGKLGA